MSRTTEQFRELYKDPVEIAEIAKPALEVFGIGTSIADSPERFAVDVKEWMNPRYIDEEGSHRRLSRQELREVGVSPTIKAASDILMDVSAGLSLTHPAFEFDEKVDPEDLDGILILPGVPTETKRRLEFGISGPKLPIYLAGSDVQHAPSLVEAIGMSGEGMRDDRDIAAFLAEQYGVERLEIFDVLTGNPTTQHIIRELLLRTGLEKPAVIGSSLFVGFMSIEGAIVSEELGKGTDVRLYSGVSSPETVARRNENAYVSEMAKMLQAAATLHYERARRNKFR